MSDSGSSSSVAGQGQGLQLIRSIAESTGPQGAPRPRFFIRPSTHALQAATPNISITQTMGQARTTSSGPFHNTISQSIQFHAPEQNITQSASFSSSSPAGRQQVQFNPMAIPQQFGAPQFIPQMAIPQQFQQFGAPPPHPQMPTFTQAQSQSSSSSSSGGIIQQQSQQQSSGPGSYSFSSSQSSSQSGSPPHIQQMAPSMPQQRRSPPRANQSPPKQQNDEQINNWIQPGNSVEQSTNQILAFPPPPQMQAPNQSISSSVGATLMASTSASNAAVYHQSLQQDRMLQSMDYNQQMVQAAAPRRAQMNMIAAPQRDGAINRNRNATQSFGAARNRNRRARGRAPRAPQTFGMIGSAFHDIEAAEAVDFEANEEGSDENDNLDLRMQMPPGQAAALEEDLLFAPHIQGQAEYVGQRALEAVGHLSASGTFLPFPAEFARPLVEGQSILQPPPVQPNPIPFDQRLQQFKQQLIQHVQQYQQQGRAGQRQGGWHMWGFENNTGNITLNVKRGYSLVQSSFDQFMSAGVGNWKDNLVVQFDGEQGQDLGGVKREWYSVIIPSITNPDYGLFAIDSDNNNRVSVSHLAGSAQEEAGTDINQFFRFVGAVLGKAITDGITVIAPFTQFLFKTLLGQEAHVSDVASHDPELTAQLKQMEQDDVTDYNIPFSLNMDFFGEIREIELVNGGANIAVSNENKLDFIALCANHRLVGLTAAYMAALRRGFLEVIPVHLLDAAQFTPQELELLLCGSPQIDIDDWIQHTDYQEGFTIESPIIQWFWEIVKNDLDEKQRGDLLAFATGSRRPPAQGFKAMIGTSPQDPRLFTIRQRVDFTANQLPVSHTCFNLLDFPAQYENKDQMRIKLLQALETLPSGFTMA